MRGGQPNGRKWREVICRFDEQEREAGILSERFYSGQRDGQVTVRDGVGGTKRLPLVPGARLFKQGEKGLSRPDSAPQCMQIALTLLADALADETYARETHEYFSRRVVALFPERWTITRSRVLAYVNMIEQEKRAGVAAGI